jgi:hypothetical protein
VNGGDTGAIGYFAPVNGACFPVVVRVAHVVGVHMAVDGTVTPVNGALLLMQRAFKPVNDFSTPVTGDPIHVTGVFIPVNGVCIPACRSSPPA